MRNRKIIYELFYCLLVIAWLIPAKAFVMSTEMIAGLVCTLLSVIMLCVIKNKSLASIFVVLLSVCMSIYSYQYIFSAMPPVLLLCAYQIVASEAETKKKQSNGLSNVFTTATMVITVVQLIYALGIYDKSANQHLKSTVLIYRTIIPILLLFVVFYWFTCKGKDNKVNKKRDKEKNSEIKLILLLSVINMIVSMVYYFASQGIRARSLKIDFLGWYAFLLILCKTDLFVARFFDTLESKIKSLIV